MRYLIILLFLLLPVQIHAEPTSLEWEIHQLINEERESNDLSALLFHTGLMEVARAHSKDMLDRGYFAHENPEGEQVWDRATAAGIEFTLIAENLYFSSGISENRVGKEAVEGWIDSPGHYQNILLDVSFTGIGIANDGDVYYITQVFADGDVSDFSEGMIEYIDEKGSISEFAALMIVVSIILILKAMDIHTRNKKKR